MHKAHAWSWPSEPLHAPPQLSPPGKLLTTEKIWKKQVVINSQIKLFDGHQPLELFLCEGLSAWSPLAQCPLLLTWATVSKEERLKNIFTLNVSRVGWCLCCWSSRRSTKSWPSSTRQRHWGDGCTWTNHSCFFERGYPTNIKKHFTSDVTITSLATLQVFFWPGKEQMILSWI